MHFFCASPVKFLHFSGTCPKTAEEPSARSASMRETSNFFMRSSYGLIDLTQLLRSRTALASHATRTSWAREDLLTDGTWSTRRGEDALTARDKICCCEKGSSPVGDTAAQRHTVTLTYNFATSRSAQWSRPTPRRASSAKRKPIGRARTHFARGRSRASGSIIACRCFLIRRGT